MAFLNLTLEQYLELPDNLPQQDWFADHQAWEFHQTLSQFCGMIKNKPEDGNREEELNR